MTMDVLNKEWWKIYGSQKRMENNTVEFYENFCKSLHRTVRVKDPESVWIAMSENGPYDWWLKRAKEDSCLCCNLKRRFMSIPDKLLGRKETSNA